MCHAGEAAGHEVHTTSRQPKPVMIVNRLAKEIDAVRPRAGGSTPTAMMARQVATIAVERREAKSVGLPEITGIGP